MNESRRSRGVRAAATIAFGLALFFGGRFFEACWPSDTVIREVESYSRGFSDGYRKAEITISKGDHPSIKAIKREHLRDDHQEDGRR